MFIPLFSADIKITVRHWSCTEAAGTAFGETWDPNFCTRVFYARARVPCVWLKMQSSEQAGERSVLLLGPSPSGVQVHRNTQHQVWAASQALPRDLPALGTVIPEKKT